MAKTARNRQRQGSADGRRRTTRLAAAALTAVLAAAACGSGSDSGDAAATTTEATGGGSGEDTAAGGGDTLPDSGEPNEDSGDSGEDSGDSGEPESLADYLGFGWIDSDPEAQRAYYAQQEQRVAELVAACMAQEGFEYVPAVRPTPEAFVSPEDEQFVREWGFGITTTFGDDGALFSGGDDWADWTDPNEAIVEAMSDSERQAYFDTLYQPSESVSTQIDPETGDEVQVSEGFGQGCGGQAYEEIYSYEGLEELFEQLDVESMNERMQADPRARAALDGWSECMGDRGHDYEDPEDMYESAFTDLQARLVEITGSLGGLAPLPLLSPEEMEALSPEAIEDLYATAQKEAEESIDQAALAALQEEERALAVADFECSADMRREMDELSKEYEAALIEDNRALLESYRDSLDG